MGRENLHQHICWLDGQSRGCCFDPKKINRESNGFEKESCNQVIELGDAVPPSELHLDQALEEQERLDRWDITSWTSPLTNIEHHRHQPLQSDDKEDGEQEAVPRGHVRRHLLARVHSHRVSGDKNFA